MEDVINLFLVEKEAYLLQLYRDIVYRTHFARHHDRGDLPHERKQRMLEIPDRCPVHKSLHN